MLNIAICDDNASELERLSGQVKQLASEFYNTYGDVAIETFDCGAALLERLKARPSFDIIFLDIIMDDNGLDTAQKIRKNDYRTKIIFVSSSKMFALEAYEVYAFNYLIKPVEIGKLREVLTLAVKGSLNSVSKKILIRANGSHYSLSFSDILFVENDLRKVIFYTDDGASHESYDTLKNIISHLDERFISPHKSFIVNMDKVEKIDASGRFVLPLGKTADITKRNLSKIKKAYFEYIADKVAWLGRGG